MTLPVDSKARKQYPVFSGVLAYFPDAIAEVAKVSYDGNEKHNPGEPLHWARGKSDDHEDCVARHTLDAFKATTLDEKVEHLACRAWRALAALQLAVEDRAAQREAFMFDGPSMAGPAGLVDGYPYGARTVEEVEAWQDEGLPSFYRVVP